MVMVGMVVVSGLSYLKQVLKNFLWLRLKLSVNSLLFKWAKPYMILTTLVLILAMQAVLRLLVTRFGGIHKQLLLITMNQ